MLFVYQLLEFILLLILPMQSVNSLKCFDCKNDDSGNPSCGMFFKAYQFEAIECGNVNVKCGLQREPLKDGWVPIVRGCYHMGTLPGINETNGCRTATYDTFTATYCFCDTDYCNIGRILSSNVLLTLFRALCLIIFSMLYM